MVNRPKNIGTAAETAVVRWLRGHGFPHAERRALSGSQDQGDVAGIPGVVIEVKGGEKARKASDLQVTTWLHETEVERQNAGADLGLLVMARAGYGPDRAGMWWAVMPCGVLLDRHPFGFPVRLHLRDAAHLLRSRGYGEPTPAVVHVAVSEAYL